MPVISALDINMQPVFEKLFYHDGRDPTLKKVHYKSEGQIIAVVDFSNPDDDGTPSSLKHIVFRRSQAFMFTPEEVDNYGGEFTVWEGERRFSLVNFRKSKWLKSFSLRHFGHCSHFRAMFYDEFLDVICQDVQVETRGYENV